MLVTETPFLTRAALAERWGMSPRTLENWAVSGKGPAPRRFGRRVLYRAADVERFENEMYDDYTSHDYCIYTGKCVCDEHEDGCRCLDES